MRGATAGSLAITSDKQIMDDILSDIGAGAALPPKNTRLDELDEPALMSKYLWITYKARLYCEDV